MSFANPLWLLLLALLPLIVLLHAIAVRWRSTPVSSLALWREVVKDRAVSLRLLRLLRNAALVLELLAAAALAVGLAGPRLSRARGAGSGDTILVLDATASMQTREGAATRFDLARARALEVVDGLRRGDGMAIVVAEGAPRLAQPFTEDRAALRRALRGMAATDEPGDLSRSMAFAVSLRDARRGDQVVLVSDGADESLEGADLSLPWVHVALVGQAHDNIGITGFAFRRTPGAETAYEVFCSVRNFSARAVSVPLTVRGGAGIVISRQLDIPAGGRVSLGLPWNAPTVGRVEASIATGDAFPVDDRAYAVFAPSLTVRVGLAGNATFFLEKALQSLPGLVVSPLSPRDAGAVDLSIYVSVDPPLLERGNYILFSAVPPNLPISVTGTITAPPVTGWNRSSPLLSSVSLSGLVIGEALAVEPGPGFDVLAASRESPLILTWEQTGLKVIVVTFDPQASDFPLRPGFPLFLANAVSWFFPAWLSVQAEQVQTGAPRALEVGDAGVTVVRPDGRRIPKAAGDPSREFHDTEEAGFYRVESGATVSEFAASLVSESESDIAPRLVAATGTSGATAENAARAVVPVWPLLAASALVLLLAEWLVWLRTRGRRWK